MKINFHALPLTSACSSVGRARSLYLRGPRFESWRADTENIKLIDLRGPWLKQCGGIVLEGCLAFSDVGKKMLTFT